MEDHMISQTALDQLVGSGRGQMIKAAIPYLPPKGRRILSIYEKAQELANTISLFSGNSAGELCAMDVTAAEPLEVINDIRRYCYGENRDQLDRIVNMMAMLQMVQLFRQENDIQKGEDTL